MTYATSQHRLAGPLRLLGLAFVLAAGSASAENYVQFRYFYPSSGLQGVQLDGQYSSRSKTGFGVSLRASEISAGARNFNVSLSSGGYFGYASVQSDTARQGATYTALAGYSSPNPGLFSDATLTYVRAEDWRAAQGYTLNSVTLDLRGQLGKEWRWNATGGMDQTLLLATPDAPSRSQSLGFGVKGKLGQLDLNARTRLSRATTSDPPGDKLTWTANLDAGLPLTATERLSASVGYSSATLDSESLGVSSTRFKPLTLGATVSRAGGVLGARVNAEYAFSEALSLAGEYGLSFAAPLTQDGSLSLDYRKDAWTLSAGLAAERSADVNDAVTFSVSPRLSVGYVTEKLSLSVRGNARYSPLAATTTSTATTTSAATTPASPWSYHLDASVQTLSKTAAQPLTFALNLKADSASSSRPATAEVGVQALYRVGEKWALNASTRYRLGTPQPSLQFGVGVRYVF